MIFGRNVDDTTGMHHFFSFTSRQMIHHRLLSRGVQEKRAA
jgi:hypothetical protein